MSRIHAPHVEGRFGTDASDTLLSATVYLGMFENRQMNASKLADYVGAPRSTMDLEELERVGRVERRARQGIEPVPPPCQGSPRHQFSCEIRTKRPVEVNSEHERMPFQWPRLPTPVAAKAGSMPTNEGLGLEDRKNLQD